jgi:hypothetical protein
MSEDKNIEEQPEGSIPPKTDDTEKAGEESSFSPEQKKTVLAPEDNSSIPVSAEPEIINKPGNSIMEVHHHGHVHEKKKWKEYVFQFFMLFLAVFCGFLAEYQLEHVIENKREKQYMASLVRDLELDSTQLASIRKGRLSSIARIDSTISLFATHTSNAITIRQFNLTRIGLRGFFQNSGTLDQLKNAGGLRLIRNRNIVDSIESYDNQIKRMILRDQYETNLIYDYNKTHNRIFDGRIIAKIHADTSLFNRPPPSPETLIHMDPEYVAPFLNELLYCRVMVEANMVVQAAIARRGKNLIKLIKAEYHLK